MMTLEQAIESLSDEELDLLNSDPELLAAFKDKYGSDTSWMNEPGLETSPIPIMGSDVSKINRLIKAGGAGIGEITTGKGLEKAAETIKAVKAGEEPTTTAGKVGEFIGEMVTPEQIALQGGFGAVLEGLNIGPWAANLLKEWGEKAALKAIGVMKRLGEKIGSEYLPDVARFVLSPLKIGEKEFEPIITAFASPADMKAKAIAIRNAVGKALEKLNPTVDAALSENYEPIRMILKDITAAKKYLAETAGELAEPITQQYEKALTAIWNGVLAESKKATPAYFSKLREFKTVLGDLISNFDTNSPIKKGLVDIYGAVGTGLDKAAASAGPEIGTTFSTLNDTYNKVLMIIEALEGKNVGTWITGSTGTLLGGLTGTVGAITHSPLAAMIVPATAIGAAAAQKYGPQALAAGLGVVSKVAPFMTKNVIPPAANTIYTGLKKLVE